MRLALLRRYELAGMPSEGHQITILGRTVLSQVHSTTNSGEVDLDVSSHLDLDAANFHLLTHHRLYIS